MGTSLYQYVADKIETLCNNCYSVGKIICIAVQQFAYVIGNYTYHDSVERIVKSRSTF